MKNLKTIGIILLSYINLANAFIISEPKNYSLPQSKLNLDILVENFINLATERNIEVEGIGYLESKFSPFDIANMISAFTLIPLEHFSSLEIIFFQSLEFGYGGYDKDKKMIMISVPDIASKTIIHEIGHLVHFGLEEINFQSDYEFLSKFYYEEMGFTPPKEESLWPEGAIRETFAVMYQMYIAEPERLRNWVEGREKAFNNYLFMKNFVFSGEEY
ncbi:MAG: hypothetical protein P9L98_01125 [Candidatus Kaelpia imicola]|nr:hypothetical protein [Candidatus Kaelpia imicola]